MRKLPGSTVGVLGSGQLGRMFAIAVRRMGYRVHTFSPDYDTPTGQVADLEIQAAYDDLDAVRKKQSKSPDPFEFLHIGPAHISPRYELTTTRLFRPFRAKRLVIITRIPGRCPGLGWYVVPFQGDMPLP